MTLQLTHRQSHVLAFVRQRLEQDGQAPTLEEIGIALGIAQVSAVRKHLRALEAKGRLLIEPHRARGIQLVRESDPMDADTMELPLIGRIAAGEPIFSEARIERMLRVSRWLFRLSPDYLVRVVGDSMRDEGILDGDLVGVHATPVARHGQIVAARIDGDRFTIKRLHWQGEVIRLLPNSPGFHPIDPDPSEDFAIEGLFAGLLRGG
ncbi:transcriptional repressor LexA [Frateuria aurantia]|uniref:LexA repressor n=1 Tax=Frateuria aurantia (strain ATCC 33424 / DSM 6220 / KCTC 2777 / LMG 1558 / NBRC 3245 / NCIMB 13370) TaxID=767434 RepID=H8L0Z9_FRAAD|nr:transcriptional repressor LexA [Frateuria aurantia]AFC86319.1 SOS regulatory protein LexA [Frateuria aurantia DSM 6220]